MSNKNTPPAISNRIVLRACPQNPDSPRNFANRDAIRLRRNDAYRIDVLLMENGAPASLEGISRLVLEILDIGARNAPLPRAEKTVAIRTVYAADFDTTPTAENLTEKSKHASFYLDGDDTNTEAGEKWLNIVAYGADDSRRTFAQGWIYVEPSFGNTPQEAAEKPAFYLTKAECDERFARLSKNLSDLPDATEARRNLNVPDTDAQNVLARQKSDAGGFCLRGGKISCPLRLEEVPFSIVFDYSKSGAWETTEWTLFSKVSTLTAATTGLYCRLTGGTELRFYLFKNSLWSAGSYIAMPISALPADGKRHSVAICIPAADAAQWSSWVDGRKVAATHYASPSFAGNFANSEAFSISNYGERFGFLPAIMDISRFKIFNFDISAQNSPYTVADHAAAHPVPESLHGGTFSPPFERYNFFNVLSRVREVWAKGDSITVYPAAGIAPTNSVRLGADTTMRIFKGESLTIKMDGATTSENLGFLSVSCGVGSSISTKKSVNLTAENKSAILTAADDYEAISVRPFVSVANATTDDDFVTVNGIRFIRNCALAELEDTAAGAFVRDVSGNGNHAVLRQSVFAKREDNPSVSRYVLTFDANSAAGAYVGGDKTIYPLAMNTLNVVRVLSNQAASFNVGNTKGASVFKSSFAVKPDAYTQLEIKSDTISALCFTPTTASANPLRLNIIIEHRKTI